VSDEPAHRTTVFPGRQSLTDCKCVCIVCLNDLERAYWMGTEIGQLGGYEPIGRLWISRSDTRGGWVVQRGKNGVWVPQIQGGR